MAQPIQPDSRNNSCSLLRTLVFSLISDPLWREKGWMGRGRLILGEAGRDKEREESIGQRECGETPLALGAGRRKPCSNGRADEGRGEVTGRPGQGWEQDGRGSEKPGAAPTTCMCVCMGGGRGEDVSERTKEGSRAEARRAGGRPVCTSSIPRACCVPLGKSFFPFWPASPLGNVKLD